jgi:hypothetical protein
VDPEGDKDHRRPEHGSQIGTYDDLEKDEDGSVTLYIQHASPAGTDCEEAV